MDMRQRRQKQMAYIADERLCEEMAVCKRLMQKLNTIDRSDFEGIRQIVRDLFGKVGENVNVNPPFYCDYGTNIEVGDNFYANYNCTLIDVAKIKIGDNCLLAPSVSIYTAGHPVYPTTRNSGYEYGKEVVIGDNVWIGGNVTVCPGVTIGSNTVIGAGSVVTKDIPAWSIAAGNPARVIRTITEADKRKLFKEEDIDDEAWEDIEQNMEF